MGFCGDKRHVRLVLQDGLAISCGADGLNGALRALREGNERH